MKRIAALLIFGLLFTVSWLQAEIVRNRSYDVEGIDSTDIECTPLDSAGQPVALANGDSVTVIVRAPGGDSVFGVCLAYNDAAITAAKATSSGRDFYSYMYRAQVSEIDGAGARGTYKWKVTVWDSSLVLTTPYRGEFDAYDGSLYDRLDSTTAYLTEEYTNLISNDIGLPIVPDGNTWTLIASASTKDSITITSDAIVGEGDTAHVFWIEPDGTSDSIMSYTDVDTTVYSLKRASNFVFWLRIEGDHNHEGMCGAAGCFADDASDQETPLGTVRFYVSHDNTFANAFVHTWGDGSSTWDADSNFVRGWQRVVVSRNEMVAQGTIDWETSTIEYVGFSFAWDSTGAQGKVTVDGVRMDKRSRPVWMFRFDDGSESQFTIGAPMLAEYGWSASAFICARHPDSVAGSLSWAQIDTLYWRYLWDMANHGYAVSGTAARDYDTLGADVDSIPVAATTETNQREMILETTRILLNRGYKRGAKFFSYPYNGYDDTTLSVLMDAGFDFATGGKFGAWFDHIDVLPPGTDTLRYLFPYLNFGGNVPFDTVTAWIDRTIERGNPAIFGLHGFVGHRSDTLTPNVDGATSDAEWVQVGETFDWECVDGITPNDATYTLIDGAAADQAVFVELDDWPGAGFPDTVVMQFRAKRGGNATADDSLRLQIDTVGAAVTLRTVSLTESFVNYPCTLLDMKINQTDDLELGVENVTVLAGGDQLYWSWTTAVAGQDSTASTTTDSSRFRAICNYLYERRGRIDVMTMSEYFRTQGSGGRLTTVARQTKETRDSMLTLSAAMDDMIDTVNSQKTAINEIAYFLGACDSCFYVMFPNDGSANKDSIYVFDPRIGTADSLVGRIVYYHSNVAAVYDSSRFDRGPTFPAP